MRTGFRALATCATAIFFLISGEQAAAQNQLSFRGCVVTVGDPPAGYSGRYTFFQAVDYRIVEVISGTAPGGTVAVRHTIVSGKADVDPNAPRLLPSIFRPNAGVRVDAVLTDIETIGRVYVASEAAQADPGLDCTTAGGALTPRVILLIVLAAAALLGLGFLLARRRRASP